MKSFHGGLADFHRSLASDELVTRSGKSYLRALDGVKSATVPG